MPNLLISVAAGILLGVVFTASPLTVAALALFVPVVVRAGRGLPDQERRVVTGILLAAIAVRALAIGALAIIGIPHHDDLGVGALTGDDAYYLARALRTRDVLLGGSEIGKYDYFVLHDDYGRTSYIGFLTAVQWLFGPTPFSLRLLNALFFVTGSVLLFRVVRPAFGPLPSLVGFTVLLFLPSLLWSSISIPKEPAYFLCACILIYCLARIARERRFPTQLLLIATGGVMLWLLDDLRRGALVLAVSGLLLALVIRFAAATRMRLVTVALLVLLGATAALSQPRIQARVIDSIESLARTHGGHVFTVGHAYKLLDEGFYVYPAAPAAWPLELTGPQAARFIMRGAVSFLITPLPWEMRSLRELAFLPEHLIWYVVLFGIPAGVWAGWKYDPWTVSILIGFSIPIAAAVALTTGNVGTLLRLRGLVTPYLLWVSVLGLMAMADALIRRLASPTSRIATPLEGHA